MKPSCLGVFAALLLIAGCANDDNGGTDLGPGGATGSGGSSNAAADAPCIASPSEGVIIGDSYVTGAASPALQPALGALYPTALSFRNYAVPGSSMASGGIATPIPTQFDQAVAADSNIVFSIMDGGGNDILVCDGIQYPNCATLCSNTGSSQQQVCRDIVDRALVTADQLMADAADVGVQDVIYFFYPHIPANNGGYTEILDYGEPLVKARCDGAEAATGGRLRCHFVALIKPFADAGGDRNPANFAVDGIHPSQAGQDIIAQQIWSVMQNECLGQTASNKCCTP